MIRLVHTLLDNHCIGDFLLIFPMKKVSIVCFLKEILICYFWFIFRGTRETTPNSKHVVNLFSCFFWLDHTFLSYKKYKTHTSCCVNKTAIKSNGQYSKEGGEPGWFVCCTLWVTLGEGNIIGMYWWCIGTYTLDLGVSWFAE